MTRKRYEELLHAEHPFQLNANQANGVILVALSVFGVNEDIPFVTRLEQASCINPSKKDPRKEILEALITPKEMLLLDMVVNVTQQNGSPVAAVLEDLPTRCKAFLDEFHPDSIREREAST